MKNPLALAPPNNRQIHLEAMRGLCALIVVFWHCAVAFVPEATGVFPGMDSPIALNKTYFYFMMNGNFAVVFFFVLSGFVLTRRYFTDNDEGFILRNLIKRLPRLAGPTIVVTLVSWILFQASLYAYADAAKSTGSSWLEHFGGANGFPFVPNFWTALMQGAFMTFLRGDSFYDSSLWTMHYEFVGSLLSFGMALILGMTRTKSIKVMIFLLFLLPLYFTNQGWYAGFPAGVMCACLLPVKTKNMSLSSGGALFFLALWLAGYSGQDLGFFRPLYYLFSWAAAQYVWVLAASLLIIVSCCSEEIRKIFTCRFFSFLGWISFPLYLVHVLVLCSLGSASFFLAQSVEPSWPPSTIAIAATVIGSFIAAIPLAYFNDWWMAAINKGVTHLLSREVRT